jgi:hypothetical protein
MLTESSHEAIAFAIANTCNCILIVATVRRQPISADSGNVPDFRPNLACRGFVFRIDGIRKRGLWESAGYSNQFCLMGPLDLPASERDLPMDLNEIIEFLHTTARSVGAEVTSPWFYLQFGLILAGAGIAYASGAAIRAGST